MILKLDPVLANQVIEESSTPTQKIEEPEQEIFETKLGEIKREPKGQHLSKDEIEKKAKELAEERREVEKLEAVRQRLEEERKKAESLAAEKLEAEMQESKQKLETEMLAGKQKLEAERQRLEEERKKVNRIRNTVDNITKSIYETIPTNYSSNLPSIHITQGISNIYYDIEKLIENATGIVYIVITLKDLSKMYHTNIPEKIKICEKNGGQIRLLTEVSSDEFLPFVIRFGATEARQGKLSSKGRIIVEGGKQVIMSDVVCQDSNKQNTQYDYAICTNSNEIVNNIFTLCSFLWEKFNKQNDKISKNSENSQPHYDTIPITF